jgi:4-amino-4-deoxy-L-arabinose transferase-like glycosyltransferase
MPEATNAAPPADAAPAPPARVTLADPRLQAGLIALLAFIVRLIYFFEISAWPFFYAPAIDSGTQYQWAQMMLKTPLWIGSDAVLAKAPLYAYYLAANIWVFGDTHQMFGAYALARLGQLCYGALTCGLIYLLTRRVFGNAAAIIAGVLAALFAPSIFNEGELLDTALATFLTAAFLYAFLCTADRPTTARWLGAGVLLGLAGITRPNLLLLIVPSVILLVLWQRGVQARRAVAVSALVFVVGVAILLTFSTLRNAINTGWHEFIPVSTNGGINLYTGNSPTADGFSPIPAGIAWERSWYEWKPLGWLTASQQDTFYRGRAIQFWRQHPGRALALLVKKCYLFWNDYDVPNNISLDWGKAHSRVLRALPLGFGVIGTLGLVGMLLGVRRNREALLLVLAVFTIMFSVVMVFVAGRYRSPMLPALFPFVGLAVVEIARAARARQTAVLVSGAVGLVAFGLLLNSDLYGVRRAHGANRDDFYLGQCYSAQQDRASATAAWLRGAQANPKDADAWAFAGQAEQMAGDLKAAAEHYRRALAVAPDYARVASWLATISLEQGWPLEEPRQLLARALEYQTDSVEGLAAMVRVALHEGDKKTAEVYLPRLANSFARYNPSASQYQQVQALVQAAAGEAESAGLTVPTGDPNVPGPIPRQYGGD